MTHSLNGGSSLARYFAQYVGLLLFRSLWCCLFQFISYANTITKWLRAIWQRCVGVCAHCTLPNPFSGATKESLLLPYIFFLSCNALIAIASKLMTHLICMAHKMPMVLHKNAPVHTTNESYLMIRAQLSSLL